MRQRYGRVALFFVLCILLTSGTALAKNAVSAEASAPFTFSDPDGLEMILESLTVKAAVQGPLSLTEMDMTFRNPRDRVSEGRFSCVLPPDAAISRLAKEVNGQLMEGEIVERIKANRIYEDILNQRRDPALLEQDQGNRFSLRVFPIEPNGTVRIVLSWTRLLRDVDGVRIFTVPLRGLDQIGKFSFTGHLSHTPEGHGTKNPLAAQIDGATIKTAQVLTFERTDWTPDEDVVLTWNVARTDVIMRAGDDWIAVLHPEIDTADSSPSTSPLVFYIDSSASAAGGLMHRIRTLELILDELGDRQVELYAFDQSVVPLSKGSARDLSSSIGSTLLQRGFLGATDITSMLAHLSRLATDDGTRTFVVVTDGAATIGAVSSRDIARSAEQIPAGVNVHALVLGSRRDDASLTTITEERGRIVSVPFNTSLEANARAATHLLLDPLGESMEIGADEADFFWPSHVSDLHRGDEIIVTGRTAGGRTPTIFTTNASGKRRVTEVGIESLPDRMAPLLEREVTRGYLTLLARRERDETVPALREALAAEQIRVSMASRVLIPRTTILVLESENDYARYQVDRLALGRILTIGEGGVEIANRGRRPMSWNGSVVRVGAMRGKVRHEGAPLPGVTVTATSSALQGSRVAVTDVNGDYNFPALPPGQYTIRMEMEGLDQRTATVSVPGGRTLWNSDVNLSLASVSEAITVTTLAPATLETTEVQTNFSSESVDSLPVSRTIQGGPPSEARSHSPVAQSAAVAEAITVTAAAPAAIESQEISTTIANDGSIRPLPGITAGSAAPRQSVHWNGADHRSLGALASAARKEPGRATWSEFAEALAARGKWEKVDEVTREWQPHDPSNPQVYELIGEAAWASGDLSRAERAFGSLVETAAANPELVQRAGMLLFRLGKLELAESALRLARESRPDRVNAWRHLALVLWQAGRHEEAERVLLTALERRFVDRQRNVHRVMAEELGYVYRDWIRVSPDRKEDIARRARENEIDLTRRDALRITLAWDTDANDVDLHVIDPTGEEVYYEHTLASSGLELYEDVTEGFGPEVVRTASTHPGAYQVGVNYFATGPMGVSRGVIVVIRESSDGKPGVEVLPFRLRPESESVIAVARLEM